MPPLKEWISRAIRFVLAPVRSRRSPRARARARAAVISWFPSEATGAEVGVWKGDFSSRVLKSARPTTLHLIDPWLHVPSTNAGVWYGGGIATCQADMDAIAEGVASRFRRQVRAGQVCIHRVPSVVAAEEFGTAALDWVYLDGDHTFEGVTKDLEVWWPTIRVGGVLTGDDYVDKEHWGVKRAVDDFRSARSDAELVLLEGSQYVFRKTAL